MQLTSKALNATFHGAGRETLVLAHGFGGSQAVWADCLPRLSRAFRVLTYDLACAGTADTAYFDLTRHGQLEGHAEDLISILSEQHVSACTFVGHSVSGMIGILAATERPDLFSRLILLGSSACYLNDGSYQGGFTRDAVEAMLAAIQSNFRSWATGFAPVMLDRPIDHPATETFLDSMLRMRPDIAVGMAQAIFLADYRDKVALCPVPAVILQTRQDPAVPIGAAEFLHQHLPGSGLRFIETTGHLPQLSAPRETEAALLELQFDANLPRASAGPGGRMH
jgi:sigma-B regulation protein RsbQ